MDQFPKVLGADRQHRASEGFAWEEWCDVCIREAFEEGKQDTVERIYIFTGAPWYWTFDAAEEYLKTNVSKLRHLETNGVRRKEFSSFVFRCEGKPQDVHWEFTHTEPGRDGLPREYEMEIQVFQPKREWDNRVVSYFRTASWHTQAESGEEGSSQHL